VARLPIHAADRRRHAPGESCQVRFARRRRVVLALVPVSLVLSACGGSGHGGAATAGSVAVTGSTGSPAPATSASASATLSATPSATPSAAPSATPPATPDAATPCGTAAGGAHYAHVVWIWMENKPYGSVIGSKSAPYENSLAAKCGSATDYHGVTHPSLPNYLAATGGSTFGVHDDASPSSHKINGDSLFGQLDAAGLSWRSYEESMPSNCATSASGRYAVKHNPAAYFTSIRAACAKDDVPFAGAFAHDVAAGTLPSFSFVTPDLCSDTHDCSVHTGDGWLATWVPKLLDGPNYRAGDTLLVVTWDEGEGSVNITPTIVVAPSVRPGLRAAQRLDHYALLRTTEDLLGVGRLGAAAAAPSLGAAFGL
jgi:phosphatidylinositol-3-phosphatase